MFQNAEEAKKALDYATAESAEGRGEGRWIATVNTVLLSVFQQLDKMKAILGNHHGALQKFQGDLQALTGGTDAPAPVSPQPVVSGPPQGGPRVGADGTPITDQSQLEAEALMDAAAGPHPGTQPQPVTAQSRRRRPGAQPARGPAPVVPMQPDAGSLQPRRGADGSLITDPEQLAAEAMMDAATEG